MKVERGRATAAAGASGTLWVLAYLLFMRVFPDDAFGASAYRYRDDALISLSHARGLVDVGTVSVGVSGARVEGYSSPLQFSLAWAYYRLGGPSATQFLDAQIMGSTFVLGVAVYAAIRLAAPRRSRAGSLLVAAAVAPALLAVYPVFAWHASGMENSLTNALVVAAVVCVAWSAERGQGFAVAGLVVGLLSLSRAEFVVHAAPILVVGAVIVALRWRSWRRVALLVVPAAGLWALVQSLRFAYFGSLVPNSGTAQRIDAGKSLGAWIGVLWPLALVLVTLIVMWSVRGASRAWWATLPRRWWCWLLVAGAVQACVFLAVAENGRTPLPGLDALEVVARFLGLWWWVLGVVGLTVLALWQGRVRPVHVLLSVPVVTGIAHIPVFGPARLALERVVTFTVVPLVVLLGALVVSIEWSALVRGNRADKVLLLVGAAACLFAFNGLWLSRDDWNRQWELCCDQVPLSTRILDEVSALERRTGMPSPMVANADIGYLSLQKRVNVTDLGLLGDPLLARLWNRSYDAGRLDDVANYLSRYATPDVVEAHGNWSCQYSAWLGSDEFIRRYRKVWDDGWSGGFMASQCPRAAAVGGGIWVRDDYGTPDGRAELALSRALARDPSPERVRRALAECRGGSEVWSCQYVTRAVYRNLKAFADARTLDRAVAQFRGPTSRYDRAVLRSRSRGDWYATAVDFLSSSRAERAHGSGRASRAAGSGV